MVIRKWLLFENLLKVNVLFRDFDWTKISFLLKNLLYSQDVSWQRMNLWLTNIMYENIITWTINFLFPLQVNFFVILWLNNDLKIWSQSIIFIIILFNHVITFKNENNCFKLGINLISNLHLLISWNFSLFWIWNMEWLLKQNHQKPK